METVECKNPNLNRILVNSDGSFKVEEYSEYGGGANGRNGWMAGGFDWKSGPLEPGTTGLLAYNQKQWPKRLESLWTY